MVRCNPEAATGKARLYTQVGNDRNARGVMDPQAWYTTVAQAECVAGAEFDAAVQLKNGMQTVTAMPPFFQIDIDVSNS
jgi:hypothetical protein